MFTLRNSGKAVTAFGRLRIHRKRECATSPYEAHRAAAFHEIVAEANHRQEQDSEIDHFFDVPLTSASKLSGFKHDDTCDGLNPPSADVLLRGVTCRAC